LRLLESKTKFEWQKYRIKTKKMLRISKILGEQIRKRRKALGLTQESLSKKLFRVKNLSYISLVESGKKDMNLVTVERLMDILGLEIIVREKEKAQRSDLDDFM